MTNGAKLVCQFCGHDAPADSPEALQFAEAEAAHERRKQEQAAHAAKLQRDRERREAEAKRERERQFSTRSVTFVPLHGLDNLRVNASFFLTSADNKRVVSEVAAQIAAFEDRVLADWNAAQATTLEELARLRDSREAAKAEHSRAVEAVTQAHEDITSRLAAGEDPRAAEKKKPQLEQAVQSLSERVRQLTTMHAQKRAQVLSTYEPYCAAERQRFFAELRAKSTTASAELLQGVADKLLALCVQADLLNALCPPPATAGAAPRLPGKTLEIP